MWDNGKHSRRNDRCSFEELEDRALFAAVVHVDLANLSGVQNGTVSRPFRSIQAAVEAVDAGGMVKVAKGTYVENVIVADKSVQLLGGFAGGGDFDTANPGGNLTRIRAQKAAEPTIDLQNITDRDILIDGFSITGGHNGIHIVSDYQLFSDVTISRNVIEGNGPARLELESAYDTRGGGIHSTHTNLTISNNVVRNNNANRGGGLYVAGGDGYTINDNVFEKNSGYDDHGGGVFLIPLGKEASGNATFARNIVSGNVAAKAYDYGWGGGVLVAGWTKPADMKPVTLVGNTITNNSTPSFGGGLFVDEGATVVSDRNLFFDNHAGAGAAGIYVDGGGDGGSTLKLMFTTIANNQAGPAAAIFAEGDSTVTIANSILYGNGGDDLLAISGSTITAKYSDIQENTPGLGVFSANPLFTNAAGGDFSLKAGSPAIDKGDPAAAFANEPGPNGGRVNLGHFGNTAGATTSSGANPEPEPNPNPNPNPTPARSATKTGVKKSASTTKKGQKLTLTVTITKLGGAGTPGGKVRFFDDATALGAATIKVVNGVAKATFSTTKLAVGTHSLTAVYAGNTLFETSTSVVVKHVVKRG